MSHVMKALRAKTIWCRAEIGLAGLFGLATIASSVIFKVPISLPSSERAAFIGVHYLYPLLAIAIWAAMMVVSKDRTGFTTFFTATPAYLLILICHFNFKLWIPHINPNLWDDFYWATDEAMRPLVDGAMAARIFVDPLIPLNSNFYMISFIVLFYVSFVYFCFRRADCFRELIVAVFLLQILGSIAYLVTPALGPFLYERGVEEVATSAQQAMFQSWRQNSELGATWLASEGGRQITVGLAAMPSLHAGGSVLFLIFAARYARVLIPWLAPLFVFITVDAVANRWHYVLDVPAGIAIAALAAFLAPRLLEYEAHFQRVRPRFAEPCGSVAEAV